MRGVSGRGSSVEEWLDTQVPPPQAVQEDGDGWRTVDSVTVMGCGLNPFRSLEGMPTFCREK